MPETETATGFEAPHIPAIDDAPDDAAESTEAEATTGTTEAAEETAAESTDEQASEDAEQDAQPETIYSKDPAINKLILEYAKEHSLDPADLTHLKILNRLAHKENQIRKLQAATTSQSDGLTEYEKSLRAKTEPATETKPEPAKVEPGKATTEATPSTIGQNWRDPRDAYQDASKAWAKAVETGDFGDLAAVEQAIYERRTQAIVMPVLDKLSKDIQALNDKMGGVLPAVTEMSREEAREFALRELTKIPEYQGIGELEKEIDGTEINFKDDSGRDLRVPNTLLNKIIAENPFILDIRKTGKTQEESDRLTFLARYRAAWRIHSGGKIDPQKATALMKAGETKAQRETLDRARQASNGGRGATARSSGQTSGSFVKDELLNIEGEQVPFGSL